jgi:hypothetical protein
MFLVKIFIFLTGIRKDEKQEKQKESDLQNPSSAVQVLDEMQLPRRKAEMKLAAEEAEKFNRGLVANSLPKPCE